MWGCMSPPIALDRFDRQVLRVAVPGRLLGACELDFATFQSDSLPSSLSDNTDPQNNHVLIIVITKPEAPTYDAPF